MENIETVPPDPLPSMSMDRMFGDVASDEADRSPASAVSFQLLEIIGQGGMGVVYRALQDRPERIVALKILKHAELPRNTRRFEREIEALAQLQHAGISRLYSVGHLNTAAAGRTPFLAMEYIDGLAISEYARKKNLSAREKLRLMIQVCEAIDFAHRRGIIHRDLKPSNILVDKSGTPRVLDFGLAAMCDSPAGQSSITEAGQILGTLDYMSPEQALGKIDSLDGRTDVYSLGVILFELLSGKRPFDLSSRSIIDAVQVLQNAPAARLSSTDRAYRGDLDTIVGKALAGDPSQRYAGAQVLAEDLRRFLENQPILARRPTAVYRARKFIRRNRLFVAAVSLIIAGLTTGLVIAVRAQRRASGFEHTTSVELAYSQLSRGDLLLAGQQFFPARERVNAAWDRLEALHESAYSAELALFAIDQGSARPIRPLPFNGSPASQVTAKGFSPQGYLALGYDDGRVEVSDPGTGKIEFSAKLAGTIWNVAFSPDGKKFLAHDFDNIRLWDWQTKSEISAPNSKSVGKLLVALGNEGLAYFNGDKLHLLDFSGSLHRIDLNFPFHAGIAVAGRSLELIDAHENLRLYPLDRSDPQVIPLPPGTQNAALSPQGDLLLCPGAIATIYKLPSLERMSQWNTGDTAPLMGFVNPSMIWIQKERNAPIRLVDLMGHEIAGIPGRDGSLVVSNGLLAAAPDDNHRETLWAVSLPNAARTLVPGSENPTAAAISPDGRTVVVILKSGKLRFIAAATGDVQSDADEPSPAIALEFAPDGKTLFVQTYNEQIQQWDAGAKKIQASASLKGLVSSFCGSPSGDGVYYVPGEKSHAIVHLSFLPARAVNIASPVKDIEVLAVSPGEKMFAAVAPNGDGAVWSPGNPTQAIQFKTGIKSVRFAGFFDGGEKIVIAGTDGAFAIFDAHTAREIGEYSVPADFESWWLVGNNLFSLAGHGVTVVDLLRPTEPRHFEISCKWANGPSVTGDGLRVVTVTDVGVILSDLGLPARLRALEKPGDPGPNPEWFNAAGLSQ